MGHRPDRARPPRADALRHEGDDGLTRIVLYDAARLLRGTGRDNPTGIDRVDIHYLEHFRSQPGTRVLGVVQAQDRLVQIPDRDFDLIWRLLKDRWIDGRPGSGNREHGRLTRRNGARKVMSRSWRWRRGDGPEKILDRRLLSLRDTHPEAEILYLNCSHVVTSTPALFAALRERLRARAIFYVHDTIPIDFPKYIRPGFDRRHEQRLSVIGQAADLVLTNSRYSAERFAAFCAARGIARPPVSILNIGIEPALCAGAGRSLARDTSPYFVTVGTIEPRKNLMLLLRVWQRLRAGGGAVPQLRLIGRRGWVTQVNRDFDDVLRTLTGDVVELGTLSDGEMVAQIAGARALLFPSFVEGWGMPLVEAQALGTPVIASDAAALREASQGLALHLPPGDLDGWETAIRRYATLPDAAATARARLTGFLPPTWSAHFAGLEAALSGLKGPNSMEFDQPVIFG